MDENEYNMHFHAFHRLIIAHVSDGNCVQVLELAYRDCGCELVTQGKGDLK